MKWNEVYERATLRVRDDGSSLAFIEMEKLHGTGNVLDLWFLTPVEKGNKEDVRQLLKNVIAKYPDKWFTLVVLPEFANAKEYEKCTPELYEERLVALINFYKENGFKEIDDYHGYKSGVGMVGGGQE